MIVAELGLQYHSLREHIGKRARFFNSKERLERLKKRIVQSDLEEDIDRKIMAVLVRSEGDSFFDIVNTLFSAFTADGGIEVEPAPWQDIVKFGLEDAFWQLTREQFGYEDGLPSLQKLLCCLFITDLFSKVGDDIGSSLQQFLPSRRENGFKLIRLKCPKEFFFLFTELWLTHFISPRYLFVAFLLGIMVFRNISF